VASEQESIEAAASVLESVERSLAGSAESVEQLVGLHAWAAGAALRGLCASFVVVPTAETDVSSGLRLALDRLDGLSFTTRMTEEVSTAIGHVRSALGAWASSAA